MKPVSVAVRVSSGAVYHLQFQTVGRFPSKPRQPGWEFDAAHDVWHRAPTDENIEAEVRDQERYWSGLTNADGTPHADRVTVLGWRRLADAERAIFERDRAYRNALTLDDGGALVHDMPKARECHRNHLRRLRAHTLPQLDAQWMRATGQRKEEDAAAIEAKRQAWRDAPADPRIDAAQSIDQLRVISPPKGTT